MFGSGAEPLPETPLLNRLVTPTPRRTLEDCLCVRRERVEETAKPVFVGRDRFGGVLEWRGNVVGEHRAAHACLDVLVVVVGLVDAEEVLISRARDVDGVIAVIHVIVVGRGLMVRLRPQRQIVREQLALAGDAAAVRCGNLVARELRAHPAVALRRELVGKRPGAVGRIRIVRAVERIVDVGVDRARRCCTLITVCEKSPCWLRSRGNAADDRLAPCEKRSPSHAA